MKADNEEEEGEDESSWDLRLEKGPSLPTTNSP